MVKWYLPTLGEIIGSTETSLIQQSRHQHSPFLPSQEQAVQQWYGAIASLNELLADQPYAQSHEGLAPAPEHHSPDPIANPI
ncbi:MAG: hypothetical protein VKJ64_04910, partial [Leptolyngbyaceae bacterium]|nr:hypothetical protein [Leptolyngbyaceae bacterium]